MVSKNDLLSNYLSVVAAAQALNVHPHTLKRWRWRNYGPKPVKVGGRLYYRLCDVQSWLDSLGSSTGAHQ